MDIYNNYQLIIIIGLPCSGKTTLMSKLTDYSLHDDFMQSFFNNKILKLIKNKSKVCINDPRLCSIHTFEKVISKILKYINKEDILLIVYENEPEKCLKNLERRNDGRKGVDKDIISFSMKYDINNYKEFNHYVLSVYDQ